VTIASGGDRRSILVAERTGRIHWSGGAVRGYFHYNGAPVIWSIDRSGRNEDFILRGSSHVEGIWAAPDGTLAVLGGRWLFRISLDHSQVKVIELGSWFAPPAVAVTQDGRMWVIGHQTTKREVGFDRDIVLKGYNPDGSLSSSHIIRLRVPRNGSQWDYEDRALSGSTLAAAGSRIAWLTSFGQYIEFAPGGQQVVYVEPPEDLEFEIDNASLALSPSGETFLAMNVQDVCVLSWLDRRTGKWIPVQFEGDELEAGSRLLGFDGNDLMALDAGLERGGFLTRLRRR
jgi:hypothetical protein